MGNAKFNLPLPPNDPIRSYAPGSPERKAIKAKLAEMKSKQIEIPLIIGGKEVKTGNMGKCVLPHDHRTVIGTYHKAGEKEVRMAVEAALEARKTWAAMNWYDRVSIFLRVAELLAGPWRYTMNAATMLAQSKNVFQAEIDAVSYTHLTLPTIYSV